jgi:hypothetical protein
LGVMLVVSAPLEIGVATEAGVRGLDVAAGLVAVPAATAPEAEPEGERGLRSTAPAAVVGAAAGGAIARCG